MAVKHDYHLAEPSPWPFLGALALFIIMLGGVLWLNDSTAFFGLPPFIFIRRFICLGGCLLLGFTLVGWWRDMVAESVLFDELRPVVKLSMRFAVLLGLMLEALYFGALFWVYFDGRLGMGNVGHGWPPASLVPADPWHYPMLATFMLLLSATTVVWARRTLAEGNRAASVQALGVSVLLGGGALWLLVVALSHLPFGFGFSRVTFETMTDPAHINLISMIGSPGAIYGSLFYVLMVSFCVHLGLGVLFLAVAFLRTLAGHFAPKGHFGFEAAAWVWHFGIVLWLLLYVGLYIGGVAGDRPF